MSDSSKSLSGHLEGKISDQQRRGDFKSKRFYHVDYVEDFREKQESDEESGGPLEEEIDRGISVIYSFAFPVITVKWKMRVRIARPRRPCQSPINWLHKNVLKSETMQTLSKELHD